jgi:hypothetical protein
LRQWQVLVAVALKAKRPKLKAKKLAAIDDLMTQMVCSKNNLVTQ